MLMFILDAKETSFSRDSSQHSVHSGTCRRLFDIGGEKERRGNRLRKRRKGGEETERVEEGVKHKA